MSEHRKKVLIIDDDELIREIVKLALSHSDFEAATLESPGLALTVIKRSRPDLILMDIYMPELNGLELCRMLKSDPQTRSIPIIIFTGSGETVDVMGGADAGAVDYITKPVAPQVLVDKIRKVLRIGA